VLALTKFVTLAQSYRKSSLAFGAFGAFGTFMLALTSNATLDQAALNFPDPIVNVSPSQ
jgi:hypothetical protein